MVRQSNENGDKKKIAKRFQIEKNKLKANVEL